MSLKQIIELPYRGDERGGMVAIESLQDIPFEIKRVYYIFGTKQEVSRGFHAHKELQQLVVCVAGKCRITLDDGTNQVNEWLDSPTKGLIVGNNVWRELHEFSADCVLLVLASRPYDETDYIRNYDEFLLKAKNV